MTQEGLEEIFAQYAQTMEAFRPNNNNNNNNTNFPFEDELFDDDDDGQEGDDLWIADEEIETILPPVPLQPPQPIESIFSQPNATLSNESVEFPKRSPSPLSEKPLPANPIVSDDTAKQARRKSGFSGNNRLSWTSDTGLTSSVVSQNLANEIMSLFDMDFAIDIKVDTAPKLPELSYRRKSQHRQSQDMLTSLIPAFEKIALENSLAEYIAPPPLPQHRPSLIIRSVPQRSSSLRNRQEILASPPPTPDESHLTKQKSLLRLASLITTKKKDLPQSPEPSPVLHQQQQQQQATYFNNPEIVNTPRKTSTSTVDSSSSSSSWSIVSESTQKPLPERPNSPDFVAEEKTRKYRHKKRKSVMEKTMSKRKSVLDEPSVPLSRSKSAFIKIGNGLKTKKQLKQIRRTSSAKNLTTENTSLYTGEHYHTVNEVNYNPISDEGVTHHHQSTSSFVKRMASFNWRMKPRNKPVEV